MAVQQGEMSVQWAQLYRDINQFREHAAMLLRWGYFLVIMGIIAATAHFDIIIALATPLLGLGIVVWRRAVRLSNICDTHQGLGGSPDWTVSVNDAALKPYDLLNSAKKATATPTSSPDNGDSINKRPDYLKGRAQLEAEINGLKQRAEWIFLEAALTYLVIVAVSLLIIESIDAEIASRGYLISFFGLVPTLSLPIPRFLMIFLELLLALLLVTPLIIGVAQTFISIALVIAIAAIASYRIFGIYIGYRAKHLHLRLMSSPFSSSCTSEADEGKE